MQTYCRPCGNALSRAWNAEHPDRLRQAASRYVASNPAKIMLSSARKRAKEDGAAFGLRPSDIEVPERCPVLGIPITRGDGRMSENSPSLDRIVPSRGYVPGNVRVISMRANRLKSDASLEELRALVAYVAASTGDL